MENNSNLAQNPIPPQSETVITPQPKSPPTEQQPTQLPIKPRKAFKKWVLIALVIILFLSLPIGGYLYLGKMGFHPKPSTITIQNKKPSPASNAANATANWKTFEDKQFGFTFKYPEDFIIDKKLQDTKTETMSLLINFKTKDDKPDKVSPVELLYVYNPSNLSLEKLQEKLANNPMGEGPSLIDKNDTQLTNANNITAQYSDIHYCVSNCKSYTWSYKNQVFQMIFHPNYGNKNQIYKDYFDKIFSTFKFTDQNSPTPTCKPRPACLDATPRCMIAETSDMCPPTVTPK